jgi:hypothetical protein
MQRLQKKANSSLYDYAELIKVVWQKRKSNSLYDALEEAETEGDGVRSLKDLKSIMGFKEFNKLIK